MRAGMSIRGLVFWQICALASAMPGNCAANEAGSNKAFPLVEVLEVGDRRWRATGTVSTDDRIVQMAIIEDIDTGAAVPIRQGGWISDDVRVVDVSRDSVTFSVGGKSVILRVGSGTSHAGVTESAVVPTIEIEQVSPSLFGISYNDFRNMLSADSLYSSKDSIVRVRNSNNDGLLQIKAVHQSGVLNRLGLEAGDVIIAMQGEAIEDHLYAKDVLNEIRPGSTLLVVYHRAGAIRQLSIEVTPGL
jgi:hypothetical protein